MSTTGMSGESERIYRQVLVDEKTGLDEEGGAGVAPRRIILISVHVSFSLTLGLDRG